MKALAAVLIAQCLLAGCVARVPAYAPRMVDSADHRRAKAPRDCTGCHEVEELRAHRRTDECRSCHHIHEEP